ncbi:MAG: hypothetical protein J5792_01705 [Bacteroidales bacterium]|nr:hypothetical protein [Bacteroidales bacterium]
MFIERFFFLFIAWQQKKQQAADSAPDSSKATSQIGQIAPFVVTVG